MGIPSKTHLLNLLRPWRQEPWMLDSEQKSCSNIFAASRRCFLQTELITRSHATESKLPNFAIFNLKIKLEEMKGRHINTHSSLPQPKPRLEAPGVYNKKDASLISGIKTKDFTQENLWRSIAAIFHSSLSEIFIKLKIIGSKFSNNKKWWTFSLISFCY